MLPAVCWLHVARRDSVGVALHCLPPRLVLVHYQPQGKQGCPGWQVKSACFQYIPNQIAPRNTAKHPKTTSVRFHVASPPRMVRPITNHEPSMRLRTTKNLSMVILKNRSTRLLRLYSRDAQVYHVSLIMRSAHRRAAHNHHRDVSLHEGLEHGLAGADVLVQQIGVHANEALEFHYFSSLPSGSCGKPGAANDGSAVAAIALSPML